MDLRANTAAHASKERMPCRSSSLGRRYLNRRYSSVSELLMVVPDRNVAPKSLPVRCWMVRMAKSMLSARWLPSELPSPATRSWRVVNMRFLKRWLSSTKMWSMPMRLKSATSSLRVSISCVSSLSLTSKFILRFSAPLSWALVTSLPNWCKTSRFSSTLSSSCCKMSRWISGDCGIMPNCSCERMMASQSLFFIWLKISTRRSGVKSSLPG